MPDDEFTTRYGFSDGGNTFIELPPADRDGFVALRCHVSGPTRTELQTFERDAAGELWHVTYELRDGKSVEIRRVSARGMRF